jgi:hypothetical protein
MGTAVESADDLGRGKDEARVDLKAARIRSAVKR